MNSDEMRKRWAETSEGIISGMAEWSEQHPRAKFREIEEEVDRRSGELRVKMMADAALIHAEEGAEAAQCPRCGAKLIKKGKKKRRLQTRGGREVELEREYEVCPECGQGIFPPG